MWWYATLSFVVALCATGMIVWGARNGMPFLHDSDLSGPQKFHHRPVPRVGGVGIVVGLAAGMLGAARAFSWSEDYLFEFAVSSGLAFGAGLLEDITKKVTPRQRLIATLAAGLLAAWLMGAVIRRTDIPIVDRLVSHPAGAIALTLTVMAGIANSVNIIDGFNGLASMCSVMMLLALAWVTHQVQDPMLFAWAITGACATLGFFAWNYPSGRIFLGDGGAYFLGFFVAVLGALLLARHAQVSPLFPLLVVVYPAYETLFSIYRRVVLRGRSPWAPDAVHLHTLLFRRVVSCGRTRRDARQNALRNSLTAPYLWVLCALALVPACLWWNNSAVLGAFMMLFFVSYTWLYWRIVRFRTPRWLIAPRRRPAWHDVTLSSDRN